MVSTPPPQPHLTGASCKCVSLFSFLILSLLLIVPKTFYVKTKGVAFTNSSSVECDLYLLKNRYHLCSLLWRQSDHTDFYQQSNTLWVLFYLSPRQLFRFSFTVSCLLAYDEWRCARVPFLASLLFISIHPRLLLFCRVTLVCMHFFKIKSNWRKHNLVSSVTTAEKAVLFCCDEGSDGEDPILAICIRIFHDGPFFFFGKFNTV